MPAPVWVIGAGGLLGRAVLKVAQQRGRPVFLHPIDWARGADSLAEGLRRYLAELDGQHPTIAWCAGAGVPHSPVAVFNAEAELYGGFLTEVARQLPGRRAADLTLFLASSAGAVYAGVEDPPYHEGSPTRPLAPYGHAKLALEDAARRFAATTGARAALGRISNLYGVGQNLAKAQGLISVLLHSSLTRVPVSIYVPLDTIRDYLYTEDAARLVLDVTDRAAHEPPGSTALKILASGRRTTIATLLAEARMVVGRRPLTIQAASPNAKVQAADLSMRSQFWADLDGPVVALEDGMRRVYEDLSLRHQSATV